MDAVWLILRPMGRLIWIMKIYIKLNERKENERKGWK